MKKTIKLSGKPIEYDLQRKKVKNVNIRIKSDMSVCVSAPQRVPQADIERILMEKADFILSALSKYEKRQELLAEAVGDDRVEILGSILPVEVISGKKTKAEITDSRVLVTLKDITDGEARSKAISALLDSLCRDTVEDICRAVYPKFAGYTKGFPEIKFRHMKTRWGSCNYKKEVLTFNYSLIHAPRECIEYVVYHEFTHFIHHDHSPGFHNALSRFVPNEKQLKKELENHKHN